MRILLIGANGQLGSDLVKALRDDDLLPLTHADIEITNAESVTWTIGQHGPDVVISTAAFHKVDECERDAARAFAVNAVGARYLAAACRDAGAALVYLSTDYVFDGSKGQPYSETDPPAPINVYGASKVAGEHMIRATLERHLIVRTSGLYGIAGSSGKGGNFVELMLRLARDAKPIRVVTDQVLTPTYTVDLAQAIASLVHGGHYGLFHITNSGSCSWFEFAQEIFRQMGLTPGLQATTTAAFGAPARRPAYSVLAHDAWRRAGFAELRPWQEALGAYLVEKGHLAGRG